MLFGSTVATDKQSEYALNEQREWRRTEMAEVKVGERLGAKYQGPTISS
jgi:hypothetical protein